MQAAFQDEQHCGFMAALRSLRQEANDDISLLLSRNIVRLTRFPLSISYCRAYVKYSVDISIAETLHRF